MLRFPHSFAFACEILLSGILTYFPETTGCFLKAAILFLTGKEKKLQHDVREAAECAECSYVTKLKFLILILSL